MAFPTDDIKLGPPTYGVRKGHEGICYHTTEGTGPSRAAALATATYQAGAGNTSGGSYNFIIYDGGVLLTVPYLEAAGGITTKRTNPPWEPEPWLKTMLSAAAYGDPNAYLMQVAFSGKALDLAAGRYPANMIDTAARLLLFFERSSWGKDNAVVMGHADWQTNRTDPGAGVVNKILTRYEELKAPAPPPPPPPPPDYKALYEAEKAKVVTLASQNATLRASRDTLAAELAKILPLATQIVEIAKP